MKTDINELRAKIIEEARSRIPIPAGEDEITSSMFAKEEGCTRRKAGEILNRMAEEGILSVRKNGVRNGKTCNVYRYND